MEDSISGSGELLFSTENSSCKMHKDTLTDGKAPYQILTVLTPLDDSIWKERSDAWFLTFKIYAAVYAVIFLLIGITAVVMIIKKDCIRMKIKTFLAVYVSIAILGFSRSLFLALDPYILIGFIGDRFEGWIIVSRLFAIFGFPSLVASYTLIFLTLLKIANVSAGNQWYERWKFVIPIAATPYVIAITAEVIGLTATYPALVSVIACEAFFSLWGIMMCIVFLFAGVRLLRQVRVHAKRTNRMSNMERATPEERQQRVEFANQEHARHHVRIGRTTRKIAIITYATAVLAIIYSVATASNLVALSLFIFDQCIGYMERGDSVLWLVNQIVIRTVEIPLALVMLYSITDVSAVLHIMKQLLCCCKKEITNSKVDSDVDLGQINEQHTQEQSTEIEIAVISTTYTNPTVGPPMTYLLDAQSNNSIEANGVGESPTHSDKSTQTIVKTDVAVQTEQLPTKPTPKPRKKHKHPITITTAGKFTRKHTV